MERTNLPGLASGAVRSRLVSGTALDGQDFISQREFTPTPYAPTSWEVVGEQVKERDFVPMEVSIVKGEESLPDPMFDVFDHGLAEQGAERFVVSRGAVFAGAVPDLAELEAVRAAERESLIAEHQAAIEQARQEGYEAGFSASEATIIEKYEALSGQLGAVVGEIQNEWRSLAEKLEQEALQLALQVSKRIVPAVAHLQPEYIVDIIKQGLQQLGAAEPVRIRLSPDDYEFLNVIGLPVELSEGELGVKYVSDDTITHGCIVETNYGELDLQLDAMWEQLRVNVEKAFRV